MLTPAEVARMLGVSTRTLLNYEAKGLLTSQRIGTNKRKYRIEDVEEFVKRKKMTLADWCKSVDEDIKKLKQAIGE